MPVNLPPPCPPAATPFARALGIREALKHYVPMNKADHERLKRLYWVVRAQVESFALAPEREPEAFIEAIQGDETFSWLLETTVAPRLVKAIFSEAYVHVDPGEAGKATAMMGGQPVLWARGQDMAAADPPKLPMDFLRQYEIQVETARIGLVEDLLEDVWAKVKPQPCTIDEMFHHSKARMQRDADDLARIVTSGYQVVKPANPADASSLVDALKADIDMFRPVCVSMLMRSYPKRPAPTSSPPVAKAALPLTALTAPHASHSAREAMRWRTT